jgi:hypothetical protein
VKYGLLMEYLWGGIMKRIFKRIVVIIGIVVAIICLCYSKNGPLFNYRSGYVILVSGGEKRSEGPNGETHNYSVKIPGFRTVKLQGF